MIERQFYRLIDLAKRWDCSIEDLLHLGMQDEAQICADVFGMVDEGDIRRYGHTRKQHSERRRSSTAAGQISWPGALVQVSPDVLRSLERDAEARVDLVDGLRQDGGDLFFFEVEPPVAIGREQLCMLREEVQRLEREKFIPKPVLQVVDGPAVWPWGTHETETLRLLCAAAKRWWTLYDPADPSTAPTNEAVSDWVVAQATPGLPGSRRRADAIASFLRPDDLPAGPRRGG